MYSDLNLRKILWILMQPHMRKGQSFKNMVTSDSVDCNEKGDFH